jgi:hypothetical protein
VLKWKPSLRLAALLLVVLAIALCFGFGWSNFLEW